MSEIHTRPVVTPQHERLAVDENIRRDDYSLGKLNNHVPSPSWSSERKFEGAGWKVPLLSTTMSDPNRQAPYELPMDGYQRGPDLGQRPPREQLPPLSSIFPTSRPGTSIRGSYTDRSPTFPAVNAQHSQHSRPAPATPHQEQQPWETAYSRRPTSQSISSQYQYDARLAQSPNSDLPQPPLRSIQQSSQTPNSPRFYDSRYSPKSGPRTQLTPSNNGWSPRPEAGYREYFPGTSRDTSSSFRPQPDQHSSVQSQRIDPETGPVYKESSHSIPSGSPYAATASSTASDPVTTKDGLGPKIWTGTQFLPRFVRQAEIPGEGLCYFYDDGTHCKMHIDGEAVNAHWGVTKAGKPRKRLAIACITCREKKIKCDPDYPRCTQCEKFGRVCKFKNAPRGGQGSPDSPPTDGDGSITKSASHLANDDHPTLEVREPAQSIHLSSSHRPPSLEPERNHAKRAKHTHSPTLQGPSDEDKRSQKSDPGQEQWTSSLSRGTSREIMTQLTINPFDSERELVLELMTLYYLHVDTSGAYSMLPEKPFMSWLADGQVRKSPDDLMLIYTMLAISTVFSQNPDHKERGKEFAAVGRYVCDKRNYSLQLIQSRLLLSLYYYADDKQHDCWDFAGAALQAAIGMKLNLEVEKIEDIDADELPYKFNRSGYAECRRRTFWACYIFDRFNGFCNGVMSLINSKDIFLRLPCDTESFEEQIEVNNPYFDPSARIKDRLSTVGPLAYFISIASIWSDIMTNVYRTSQRPEDTDEDSAEYLAYYNSTTARLEDWNSCLPEYLSYSPENLIASANHGLLGTFITIHSLYQTSHMKLNRHVRPGSVPAEQLEHNIRTASSHAEALLLMASKLAAGLPSQLCSKPDSKESVFTFSTPFIGYAIVNAIDIVTAKGYLSSLPYYPSKIRGAMAVITELGNFWIPARQQKELLVARNADLVAGPAGWTGFFAPRDIAVVKDGKHGDEGREGDGGGPRIEGRKPSAGQGTYEMKDPIEIGFASDNDCLYAVGLEAWQKALDKTRL